MYIHTRYIHVWNKKQKCTLLPKNVMHMYIVCAHVLKHTCMFVLNTFHGVINHVYMYVMYLNCTNVRWMYINKTHKSYTRQHVQCNHRKNQAGLKPATFCILGGCYTNWAAQLAGPNHSRQSISIWRLGELKPAYLHVHVRELWGEHEQMWAGWLYICM